MAASIPNWFHIGRDPRKTTASQHRLGVARHSGPPNSRTHQWLAQQYHARRPVVSRSQCRQRALRGCPRPPRHRHHKQPERRVRIPARRDRGNRARLPRGLPPRRDLATPRRRTGLRRRPRRSRPRLRRRRRLSKCPDTQRSGAPRKLPGLDAFEADLLRPAHRFCRSLSDDHFLVWFARARVARAEGGRPRHS